MSAPAPARPTFPNFNQLDPLLPGWLWAVLRYIVLGLALGMAGLLLQRPALGLTLFWGLAVPCLPLVFLFAPGIWRNICPLASSNQLPRRLGLAMGLTRRSLSLGLAYPVGMGLLLGFIILRKLLFNHSPAATALLIVGAMLLALIGGILFKGKSGWCSTVCPLLPVQRMLGQTAFVQVANTQCNPCVTCAKNCYDFNPGLATLADVNDDDPRYAAYRRVFAMLFPGLVLGFYLIGDLAPELAPAVVPGLTPDTVARGSHSLLEAAGIAARMLLFMGGSLLLFGLLDKLVGRTRNRVPLLAALTGFNIYYWHAAPLVAGTLGKLALLTGFWPELTRTTWDIGHLSAASTLIETLRGGGRAALSPAALFSGATLAVYLARLGVALLSLWWLLRSLRAERAYLAERAGQPLPPAVPRSAVIDISGLFDRLKRAARPRAPSVGTAGGDTVPQSLLDQYDGDPIPPELIREHRARRAANAPPPEDGRVWSSSAFAHMAQSRFAPWGDGGPPTGFGQTGFGNTGFGNTGFGNTGFGNTGFGNTGFGNAGAPPAAATAGAGAGPAGTAPPAAGAAGAADPARPTPPRARAVPAPGEPVLLLAPEGERVKLRVGQTLLDALESCGAPIHPGCRAGSCGADAVAVHDGSACLGSMSSDERATLTRLGHSGEGVVRLACVARLRKAGPVTVEVLPNTRLAAPAAAAPKAAAKVKIDHDQSIKRVLIVGNGVAGLTAAETVRAHHPDCEIHIVSRERQPSYQRIALARLFTPTTDPAKLALKSDDWYLEQRIHCWLNTRVTGLDTRRQLLTLSTGEELPYDRLIMATGAAAWVPNINGFGITGCFVMRQASDALALRNYVHRYTAKRAYVLGAGLLGIEAADALAKMGLQVTLLMSGEHLLDRQVDREAGALVAEHLRKRGVVVAANTSVAGVPRSAIGRVSQVTLRVGEQEPEDFEADLLLVCTGTRPDLALAKAGKLSVDRGILVDNSMRTSATNVFACGDVVQSSAPMWGLWAPAAEQGRIAALNALGRKAHWEPHEPITTLKMPGLSVRSAGKTQAQGKDQMELVFRQAAGAARPGEPPDGVRYTKLVTELNAEGLEQVVGAIVVGDDPEGDDILAAACERKPVRQIGAILNQRSWTRQSGQATAQAAEAGAGATALPAPTEATPRARPLAASTAITSHTSAPPATLAAARTTRTQSTAASVPGSPAASVGAAAASAAAATTGRNTRAAPLQPAPAVAPAGASVVTPGAARRPPPPLDLPPMAMDLHTRPGARARASAFGDLTNASVFGELERPSIFSELTPSRPEPVLSTLTPRVRAPAPPLDADDGGGAPDPRDAALDAAIQADLKGAGPRSRFGGEADASLFGGLSSMGDLDQSRFGSFDTLRNSQERRPAAPRPSTGRGVDDTRQRSAGKPASRFGDLDPPRR
ncbi:MAG: hypothetical protein RIQ60_39 [Pseudomonadota bacterium]|jgi:NADPH-dependent 2,4-dienoyl-CoA reductase/sulfur reductase-like enzyme/ferredoxin